jgi:hypothetical protein
MYGAGAAWAGGGGESLTTLQAVIGVPDGSTGFCHMLGMGTNFGTTCPQLPTFTQAILEAAGLANSPPEMVAAQNGLPPGSNVYASNPAVEPLSLFSPTPFPLTSTTSPTLSELLSTLTPLAFVSSPTKPTPVQLYNSDANTFLYAVTVSSVGFFTPPGGPVPDTLYLIYEDLSRSNQSFTKGQVVAKFSLPLTVLNSAGAERPVMLAGPPVKTTTLTITSCANGPSGCFMVTAAGDFLGNGTQQTLPPASCSATPAAIGISCAVVFSASPTSSGRHAIFELAVPLVVTGAAAAPPPFNTDPAYFYALQTSGMAGQLNLGLFTAFLFQDLGFTPAAGILDQTGTSSIGIAPTAGPLCPIVNGASSCPSSFTFALCASLPGGNGNGQTPVPSVAAYYGIATDGAALLSAALSSTSACPAF